MTETEKQVLLSPFLDKARNLEFDDGEYTRLLSTLESLASEWATTETVSKQVVTELFLLPAVVRGAADRLSGSDRGNRMSDAAEELETMVLRCLMPE